jgi:hypothetical protein
MSSLDLSAEDERPLETTTTTSSSTSSASAFMKTDRLRYYAVHALAQRPPCSAAES